MKVVLLVVALTVSAALAAAVTHVASSSRAVAAHEPVITSTPVWQTGVVFPDGAIPSEEVQADLDGNASALVASAGSDIESKP